jgi:hypothetical protein
MCRCFDALRGTLSKGTVWNGGIEMAPEMSSGTIAAIAAGVDTFIGTVEGKVPARLGCALDRLKTAAQEAEADVATPCAFVGETLFIKPHGAQRHWHWILHCPSLHLEMGRGRYNHVIGRARLSAAFLWEHGFDVALMLLYAFLYDLVGHDFKPHASEVHLCADLAGWDLTLADAGRFVTRGDSYSPRVLGEEEAHAAPFVYPALLPRLRGRRCRGYDFSRGAAHACCKYDKTTEIVVSRKDWMCTVWVAHGWMARRA